jgi:hypothetical protein
MSYRSTVLIFKRSSKLPHDPEWSVFQVKGRNDPRLRRQSGDQIERTREFCFSASYDTNNEHQIKADRFKVKYLKPAQVCGTRLTSAEKLIKLDR